LAGRAEASFCLDSLLLSHQGESKRRNQYVIKPLCLVGNSNLPDGDGHSLSRT
jgi:hypothetical protein